MNNANYTILNNFDLGWIEPAKQEWLKNKETLINILLNAPEGKNARINDTFSGFYKFNDQLFHLFVDTKHIDYPSLNELRTILTENIAVSFFISFSGRADPFHCDATRSVALNFPVIIDYDNSFFKIGKQSDIESYNKIGFFNPEWQRNQWDNKEKGHFDVKEGEYDTYNMKKPIVFNCKIPHGGTNFSNDIRVLGTITIKNYTYQEFLEKIPKEWF